MPLRPWIVGAVVLALAPAAAIAAPFESQPADVGGTPTQAITWTDAHGQPRTAHVLTDNHRIVRYAYTVAGEVVVDEVVVDEVVVDEVPGYGIGNLVHHGACGEYLFAYDSSDLPAWEWADPAQGGVVDREYRRRAPAI